MIGYALGGRIEHVQLGGEPDENVAVHFGDCLINWGAVNADCNWHVQREIITILAGPVAEMIYRGETPHPAMHDPWNHDWQQAWIRCQDQISSPQRRTAFLEMLVIELHRKMSDDTCWAAVAAVADALLAHEYLEHEQLENELQFWIG